MKKPHPGNPVVYLDIRIGPESTGRMIIELMKNVVPRTAENFRRLCVGDHWSEQCKKYLTFRGTRIHKVQRLFAVCGGDVVKNTGVSGESIYGPSFPDENFDLQHDEGSLSMANYGKPDSNNSQFFITSVQCPHLDGINVVFGRVLRGLGLISEMEKIAINETTPLVEISITNCGELESHQSWDYHDADDNLPPFPADWEGASAFSEQDETYKLLDNIKTIGNQFYNDGNHVDALRKYKKFVRYHQFFADAHSATSGFELLEKLRNENLLNMAACHLKLQQYRDVILVCTEALRYEDSANHSKAFYRRGVAGIETKEYESGLADLKQAHSLAPDDKNILKEFNRGKHLLLEYRETEKSTSQKMFKNIIS